MRCLAIAIVLLLFVTRAIAQIPPAPYTPPAPILNPSSPLVLPQAPPTPVSPAPGFYPGSNLAAAQPMASSSLRALVHATRKVMRQQLRFRRSAGRIGGNDDDNDIERSMRKDVGQITTFG
jgi:hypothetical protein